MTSAVVEPARLHAGLVRSLAPAIADARIAEQLATQVLNSVSGADCLEASVRVSSGGRRAGRMLIERAAEATARSIFAALNVPWSEPCDLLNRACRELSLPLIAGWDVAGRVPLAKLYANASDASVELRAALCSALGAPTMPQPGHVVGLNAAVDGRSVLKVYEQFADRPELPSSAPPALASLSFASGWVISRDLTPSGTLIFRAAFAAMRHAERAHIERAFAALTGVPFQELASDFPFPVGPLRQLGWGADGSVTVYAKPAGAAAPVNALEPVGVFRAGAVEIGLFVEPGALTPRAFVRTERHAISFRDRAGHGDRELLELLGTWAAARVTAWEIAGGELSLAEPPAPWRRVTHGG